MSKSKSILGAFLFALALALLVGIGWPLFQGMRALEAEAGARDAMLQDRTKTVADILALAQTYDNRATDVNRVSAIVPSTPTVPDLISALESIAYRSSMYLSNISLKEAKQPASANDVTAMTISVTVDGAYGSLETFLQDLEKNIRLIDVQSITVSPADPDNPDAISVQLTATAYFLKQL